MEVEAPAAAPEAAANPDAVAPVRRRRGRAGRAAPDAGLTFSDHEDSDGAHLFGDFSDEEEGEAAGDAASAAAPAGDAAAAAAPLAAEMESMDVDEEPWRAGLSSSSLSE